MALLHERGETNLLLWIMKGKTSQLAKHLHLCVMKRIKVIDA